jgi:hypothetical protein
MPILSVRVLDPGPQRNRLFQLYRTTLGVSPQRAKDLLDMKRVEITRGSRMEVEKYIKQFEAAGVILDVVVD